MHYIIASGNKYSDIDVLASSVGLLEAYRLLNRSTGIMISPILNSSVTNNCKIYAERYLTDNITDQSILKDFKSVSYVIVDISAVDWIDPHVDQTKITELYDHHFGYEEYWKSKLGANAKIEKVGACATLIVEYIKNNDLGDKISGNAYFLLFLAIISNTLNLRSSVTDIRDKKALDFIKQYINIPENLVKDFFMQVSESVFADPYNALLNDTKVFDLEVGHFRISQIELWDAKHFIPKITSELYNKLKDNDANFFITIPSISEGINYFLTKSNKMKTVLQNVFNAKFDGDIGKTQNLYLRKEIIRDLKTSTYLHQHYH